MRWSTLLLLSLAQVARSDVAAGVADPGPPGYEEWVSEIVVPSPPISGVGGWARAMFKAKKLVEGLSLEEKVNITTGIGQAGRCVGNTGEISRLGFPDFKFPAHLTHCSPAGITAAATFDEDLMYARAKAMGEEFRGKGVNVALGPMTNMGRVAVGGRNWEGFGGDPYLSGIMSGVTVKGIQESNVIACVKHFIANEEEHSRSAESSNIDDRTLHEVYAWPFADAIHAGVGSIMCAYNRINQTYACSNSKLLNGIAKKELGFQGFIVSDWAAMGDGVNSALAGNDMTMPGFKKYNSTVGNADPSHLDNSFWGAHLVEAVNNGSVPLARLDDMVTRTFAAWYQVGQDKDYPKLNFDDHGDTWNGVPSNLHVDVQGNHKDIVREIAAAGTVLLKNVNGTLPLSLESTKHIAVIGSDAGPHPLGPNKCSNGQGDRACNEGTLAIGWGSGTANFPYLIDPLAAITAYAGSDATVDSVLNDYDYEGVDRIAPSADACLVFGNSDSGEKYLTVNGNMGDRNNLTLWHGGEDLILHTASVCSNTIVVLHQVGPVIVESWIDHPNITALLFAHLPGQESGNSLVDVLFGKVNPSGRLPYTVAKAREDYSADLTTNATTGNIQIVYKEALNIDYRHFHSANIEPRFEFGFGLSYSSFEYNGLRLHASVPHNEPTWENGTYPIPPGGLPSLWECAVTATFGVKNTGKVDGHEVSQLYLTYPESAGEPPKILRGFKRTFLKSGEKGRVTLKLRKRDISVWDVVLQEWVVPKGTYTVSVGASSKDIRLTEAFEV